MTAPRIIIDHLPGARRGRRQLFDFDQTVRFGRHPESDVLFDAHKELDVSSRHAELCARDREGEPEPSDRQPDHQSDRQNDHEPDHQIVLRDVGSSNGTYIDGHRVTEVVLQTGDSVIVEFGAGGPRLRISIHVGDPGDLPPVPRVSRRSGDHEPLSMGYRLTLAGITIFIVALAVVTWVMFV